MEVILAESAGFCFGVNRAMDKVNEQIEKSDGKRKIYTYGPIIHNSEVVRDLKEKGVDMIEGINDIPKIAGQIMIIRSHGVSKEVYEAAEANGIEIVDATCPFVKKIHRIVAGKGLEGYTVLIIGDKNHPEVQGIMGWCTGPYETASTEEELSSIKVSKQAKICIVSQTTFSTLKFHKFVEIVQKRGYDTLVISTICSATAERQQEAAEISRRVNKMLVIGDPKSSNTGKLYEICKTYCKGTYHIQTVKDLPETGFQSDECVGITAGASTPHYLIQEVLYHVRGNHFQ